MVRVRERPAPHCAQALVQGHAVAQHIDILHVQNLEPWLGQRRAPRRIERHASRAERRRAQKSAARRIMIHIDFELARPRIKLLGQRPVAVVQRIRILRPGRADQRHNRIGHRLLVAVVRAHHEQIVESEVGIHPTAATIGIGSFAHRVRARRRTARRKHRHAQKG